jgi:hypothetical protein
MVVAIPSEHDMSVASIDHVDWPREVNPADVVPMDYDVAYIPLECEVSHIPTCDIAQDKQERERDAADAALATTVHVIPDATTTWTGLQLLCESIPHDDQAVVESPVPSTPATRRYESDLVVVLDMDQCLIHSTFFEPHEPMTPAPDGIDSFTIFSPDGRRAPIRVNKRPWVDDFLRAVTSRFETHVFTAATKEYANPILNVLDPTGIMLTKRWYRSSCSYYAKRRAYVKKLTRIVPSPERVVLVDRQHSHVLSGESL